MRLDVPETIRAAFVMEQHIGHYSFYKNLRQFIDPSPLVDASWVTVTYKTPQTVWNRLTFLPQTVRGPMIGRSQVRQGLRRQAADVVLFNTQVPAGLGGRLARQRPYVLCTDITPIQYDQMSDYYGRSPDRNSLLMWFKRSFNRRLFQNAARILPWSTWVRDSLINEYGVAPEHVEVVPPGVDTDIWQPQSHSRTGPLRILFVGGDFYRKGGDDLLTAVNTLPPGTVELILVTRTAVPPAENSAIYNHMQANSAELIALCQTCDIFVLPTRAEAFGIAAVEASALGLPAIVTAVGGLTDIVKDGETGYLIAPGDIHALTVHILRLAQAPSLRRQFGQAARKRAKKRFNARQNAARTITILQAVVRENNLKKREPSEG